MEIRKDLLPPTALVEVDYRIVAALRTLIPLTDGAAASQGQMDAMKWLNGVMVNLSTAADNEMMFASIAAKYVYFDTAGTLLVTRPLPPPAQNPQTNGKSKIQDGSDKDYTVTTP